MSDLVLTFPYIEVKAQSKMILIFHNDLLHGLRAIGFALLFLFLHASLGDCGIHHLASGCLMVLVLKSFDSIVCGSHFVTFPLKCKTRACLNFMRPQRS